MQRIGGSGIWRSALLPSRIAIRNRLTVRSLNFSTYRPLRFKSSGPQIWKQSNGKMTRKPIVQPKIEAPKPQTNETKSRAPTMSELKILRNLVHYIWPKGNNKVKLRVIAALMLLIGAKLLNVQVPFFFKDECRLVR